jgi:hypothetical protein
VVVAGLGIGPRELGRLRTVGPSAFDVTADETVVILDQVNRRLAVYPRSGPPRHTPITFLGGEGDLAIADDGTVYVLDGGRPREHVYFIRSYDRDLKPLATTQLAVGTQGDTIRVGEQGAIVHVFPAEQWLPVGTGRDLLEPDEQEAGAGSGQTFPEGHEVAVAAGRRETRVALFDGDDVIGSWRIRSATPFGEVQLVEPNANGLLAVLRVFSKTRAEWLVLQLTPAGLAKSFSVRPVEDLDSAATSRFRLRENVLYELQSSRTGVRVVKHDLGD